MVRKSLEYLYAQALEVSQESFECQKLRDLIIEEIENNDPFDTYCRYMIYSLLLAPETSAEFGNIKIVSGRVMPQIVSREEKCTVVDIMSRFGPRIDKSVTTTILSKEPFCDATGRNNFLSHINSEFRFPHVLFPNIAYSANLQHGIEISRATILEFDCENYMPIRTSQLDIHTLVRLIVCALAELHAAGIAHGPFEDSIVWCRNKYRLLTKKDIGTPREDIVALGKLILNHLSGNSSETLYLRKIAERCLRSEPPSAAQLEREIMLPFLLSEAKLNYKSNFDEEVINELGKNKFSETNISENIKIIRFENTFAVSKTVPLGKSLRRAVTILKKSIHPSIVRLLAASIVDNHAEIITEYMDLGSLTHVSKYIRGLNPLYQQKMICSIGVQVLLGLHFLHTAVRVTHRCINPSHIFFNSTGRVKLGSFGTSGTENCNETQVDLRAILDILVDLAGDNKYLAMTLKNIPTDTALQMVRSEVFHGYYNEGEMLTEIYRPLLEHNIPVGNPDQELISWIEIEKKETTERVQIRKNLIDLILSRERIAIETIRGILEPMKSPYGVAKV